MIGLSGRKSCHGFHRNSAVSADDSARRKKNAPKTPAPTAAFAPYASSPRIVIVRDALAFGAPGVTVAVVTEYESRLVHPVVRLDPATTNDNPMCVPSAGRATPVWKSTTPGYEPPNWFVAEAAFFCPHHPENPLLIDTNASKLFGALVLACRTTVKPEDENSGTPVVIFVRPDPPDATTPTPSLLASIATDSAVVTVAGLPDTNSSTVKLRIGPYAQASPYDNG